MPDGILAVERRHDTSRESKREDISTKPDCGDIFGIDKTEDSVDIRIEIGETLLNERASVQRGWRIVADGEILQLLSLVEIGERVAAWPDIRPAVMSIGVQDWI
jgi:hypothetical protein